MENIKKGCILVADDVEFVRGILKMLLRRDYDIVEAGDGQEAMACLNEMGDSIMCVLLDIKMPGVDGYGVLDYMHRTGLINRVPVIALTSISDPQGHIRCYESGVIDLIEKPYDEELLLYKIRWNIERFRRLNALSPAVVAEKADQGTVAAPDAGAVPDAPRPVVASPMRAVEAHCRQAFGLETETEIADMTASFMRTFKNCVNLLRDQEEEPDFEAVRDVTHKLSGFAANAGALDLADLTLVLNTCAKACHPEATSAAIRRILALYEMYGGVG